jgi:dihydropteroate synthase
MDKDTFFENKHLINCRVKYLDLSTPRIVGVINVTPDSFFDGGKYHDKQSILAQVKKMINEGADIIDVGAYSSRPGAIHITKEEEWRRLSFAFETIRNDFSENILSVDTFRAELAQKSVNEFKVSIINDVSGGMLDPEMFETIISLQVPYIMMHMHGDPQNMQKQTSYNDLVRDIIEFFGKQTEILTSKGVHDIIVDPGFGFGKTLEQNYQLLEHLDAFKILGFPIMIGVSRKSMIYRFLGNTADEALNGTTVLNTLALTKGANLLRVHDVKEAKQVVDLYIKTIEEGKNYLNQMGY